MSLVQDIENQINTIVQEYVKRCFDNNIDCCSADGFLLTLVSSKLSYFRCKLLYEK